MPYVYKEAMRLERKDKVGDGECVALVRMYAGAREARAWRAGKKVVGERTLPLGTAIATFDEDGRWPGKSKGNHAAFYLSQTSEYIRVMDQWNRNDKPLSRPVSFQGAVGTRMAALSGRATTRMLFQ